MAKAWKSGAALLAAVLALGGCQSPPRIDVEQQWADTMSDLNMFGFFPQTEDVQVGGPAPCQRRLKSDPLSGWVPVET